MPFFKKLKNNIGLNEEAKKNEDELEDEDSNENEEEEFSKKVDQKREKEDRKRKEAHTEEVRSAEKNAFDHLKTKGQLAVDAFQTEKEFCVQAPIAGVEQNDIDISVENEMLIIRGERQEPLSGDGKKYFYQECYWGPFSRQIILPEDVDSEKIKASLKNGILVIRIPKTESKKKKIVVELE